MKLSDILIGLLAGALLSQAACSRPPTVRDATDAARAVCCLSKIRSGQTPEAAEVLCESVDAVRPFLAPTEHAADPKAE